MIEPPSSTLIQVQPSSSKLPLVFVGFVLLLAAGAGGVILGKYLYGPKTPQIAVSATPTPRAEAPTAAPTPDPTVEWETYISDKYGFSVKLPEDWREVEHSSNFDYIVPFRAPDKSQIQVSVLTNGFSTLSDYLEHQDEVNSTGWEGLPSRAIVATKETIVDGYPAKERKEDWLPAGFTTIVTYIAKGKNVYSFAILPYGDGEFTTQEAAKQYHQILSTFRFLDGVSSTTTTTPQGKRLTYSLPAGWETVSDRTGTLEVGFDPARYEVSVQDQQKRIDLTGKWIGTRGIDLRRLGLNKYFYLISPSGGSRHRELYKVLGVDGDSTSWKSPTYYSEREYHYSGWNCLVINGVDISQYPVAWGYCPISASRVLVLAFDSYDWSEIEQQIATVKLLR